MSPAKSPNVPRTLLLLLAIGWLGLPVAAQDWAGYRGPAGNGAVAASLPAGDGALGLELAHEGQGGMGAWSLSPVPAGDDRAAELPLTIYLDWGRWDFRSPHEAWDMRAASQRWWDLLRERGWRPTGGEVLDGTDWASWRERTDRLLAALFPPEALFPPAARP